MGGQTLESLDVSSAGLHHLGDHVVDESVLVPDLLGLKLLGIGGIIDLLEDVLETAIILLQDGVLGGHVQGKALGDGKLERSVCKSGDGLIGVVLGLGDTTTVEVVNLNLLWLSSLGSEDHGELTLALDHGILSTILVTESMAADDDGLLPSRN
jgi:hypothetical protein